ncbi:UDP-N-acetylmuramate:L-alanyl-gamma-D-glutamyl-meso-diaminopimelate ligase [Methyloversatilis sp. XJ19-49]|uniref:UDP-N-acetylmuramate:L-alanyl-gamma-D-glutamyl- meso-diaminopimelate ligase n=1 Tax=Methyloversatilis sp. XJ19-49 TaxID=2963429 RepID=UPI00211BB6D9|nr:UDP-N-acetylmuramate:L-alanyl-gamma-D-glutamyl-meso-diaminopimelate ligase [Methyloversatilis sp. XJ19-49]MCQ9378750.1 UDP-N-acetylmuramate:L-alanyl-gamma-D-glutamyl-meso-diaminopimelate ligase [Methyloversatilis sp. XJ19-49]
MHIHILGICGTFMGGVAALAREAGHQVSGCDAGVYPPMSTQLEQLGINLIEGYDPAQIDLEPDLFVVGNAVSRGNPLLEVLLDRGLPYVSGPQWLAEHVLAGRWVLAVAGTHGKTTTTSMLAWMLEDAGLKPGFLIGGVPLNFGVSARLGDAPFFVIEADEYDTAFCDKRSKFVHYRPRTAILNNLEFDHADIFADLAAIETQFHHLVRTMPESARIIANGAEASLHRVLARGVWSEVEWFNTPSGWQVTGAGQALHVRGPAGEDVAGRLEMPGMHNANNALAAMLAARHVGVRPEHALESLATFRGIRRRLERIGEAAGVTVYDDFAHHPTAIEETIRALRTEVGTARILAVIEPRSNTMKLGVMKARLPAALESADLTFCLGGDSLGWDAVAALAPLGQRARVALSIDALLDQLMSVVLPGDHVLVMSNGGFGGVHRKLLNRLDPSAM